MVLFPYYVVFKIDIWGKSYTVKPGTVLEDIKVVTRIRKAKKDRQHNGQKKKDKRTNNGLQDIHIKLKIE
jgi:hypothetical protein